MKGKANDQIKEIQILQLLFVYSQVLRVQSNFRQGKTQKERKRAEGNYAYEMKGLYTRPCYCCLGCMNDSCIITNKILRLLKSQPNKSLIL